MTKRISIVTALAEKFKVIDGTTGYKTDLNDNSYPKLKFWDEVTDFPCVYLTAGSEIREYMPSDFTWGFLGISMKLYCHGEFAQEELEQLLQDVEDVIDKNRVLVYDDVSNYETTEILLTSITTDEGLLAPYAIGEINLQVRYVIM